MSNREAERNQEATVYLVRDGQSGHAAATSFDNADPPSITQGNLDERCTDALIWELMLQAGPICKLIKRLSGLCASFSMEIWGKLMPWLFCP